eukprot:TRINITY_DN1898_c0_g4_i3.p1 TRINITY_DN1898_c0_g4~~TRINITY_DN1898_c0_g4_i3.p1  ORF type:complete len:506 (+),score=143.67 TRINITY_DN1898_c0_g4_i3:30-1547(+)
MLSKRGYQNTAVQAYNRHLANSLIPMSEEEKWGEEDAWEAADDFVELPMAKSAPKEPFSVVSLKDVESRLNALVQSCTDLFQIPADEANVLLIQYGWDFDKLQTQWFAKEAKIRADCGIPAAESKSKLSHTMDKLGEQCPICFEDIGKDNSAYLKCHHAFCIDCWRGHLIAELDKGVACILAKCPFPKCKLRVGPSLFEKFLPPAQYGKYKKFWATAFVDSCKTLKWCPNPGCNYVVEEVYATTKEVTCECAYVFCFACGKEGHLPVNCEMAKKWDAKNTSESENVTWIAANTKPCPKCKRPIEKNQGCNHMTCSQCRYEFCWICMGDWIAHNGNYSCNKINKDLWNKQSDAKMELERYMFYFERYDNHRKAIRKAKELRDLFTDFACHMTSIKHVDMTDLKFLWTCLDSLMNVRRVLANSYIFGYYLKNAKQVQLFEFMQRDLEMTCELFHEMTERRKDKFIVAEDDNNIEFLKYKSDLINIANVTTKFYQGFIEGLSKDLQIC